MATVSCVSSVKITEAIAAVQPMPVDPDVMAGLDPAIHVFD
jgi:hypothetical protein